MEMHAVIPMMIISILSALLSAMWVWASSWNDIRLSINDFYMATLMTGWMFLLQGIYMKHIKYIIIGLGFVIISLGAIRVQLFVTIDQYLDGMIPHHSMALFMSEKIIDKYGLNPPILGSLPLHIIESQKAEIQQMKSMNSVKTI